MSLSTRSAESTTAGSLPVDERNALQDLFQLVRLLQLEAEDAGLLPVGFDAPPGREALTFRGDPSLAFPSGSASVEDSASVEGSAGTVVTAKGVGLYGFQGVLPAHYTRTLGSGGSRGGLAMRGFLDLFNHRLLSFRYRAWEKNRVPLAYERIARRGRPLDEDPVGRMLLHLIGWPHPPARDSLPLEDETLVFYSGLLLPAPRSMRGLENILSDYFGVSVRIEEFAGRWLPLDEEDWPRLAAPADAPPSAALGRGTVAGTRVWDVQSRFVIRVGPVDLRTFEAFLPDGQAFEKLVALADVYVDSGMEFQVRPVLRQEDVPEARLGARPSSEDGPEEGAGRSAPRLGYTFFLLSGPAQAEMDSLLLGGSRTPIKRAKS